ncbi:MAG: hypothetical protein ACUVRC_10730 [Desulfotomaculales bacterium]
MKTSVSLAGGRSLSQQLPVGLRSSGRTQVRATGYVKPTVLRDVGRSASEPEVAAKRQLSLVTLPREGETSNPP